MAHPVAHPSSLTPDCPSVQPSRLMKSLPQYVREPLAVGLRPIKSFPKMVSPISRPLLVPSLSVCAKAREQSVKTVLCTELPEGSSITGVKPASRIVLAPVSLSRLNVCAVAKLPEKEKKEISPVRGKSVHQHSPSPNAALTLRKSTPVSSLRVHPPASLSKDGASWSSQVSAMQHMPNAVSTRRVVSDTAHRETKTRSRVSSKAATPRCGKTPPVGVEERFNKRSNIAEGLAVKRALTPSSSEVGKKRRVVDAVICEILGKNEDTTSLNPLTALTVHASAAIVPALSILPTSAVIPRQPSNSQKPPIEAILRRCDLNVVNKTLGVYNLHSPSLETARKQSIPTLVSSSVNGEGQLARAAAYIQERILRCSSACVEFVPRTPKVPPDKKSKLDIQRRVLNVVNEAEKVSASSRSPESSTESALLFRSQFEDVLSMQPSEEVQAATLRHEAPRVDKISAVSSESAQVSVRLKCNVDGVQGRSPVLSIEAIEVDRRSSERLVETKEVSRELVKPALSSGETHSVGVLEHFPKCSAPTTRHAVKQAFNSSLSKGEEERQVSETVVSKIKGANEEIHVPFDNGDCERRPCKVIYSLNIPSAAMHSLETKADVFPPVSRPGNGWASTSCFLSIELCWRARRKPPEEVMLGGRHRRGVAGFLMPVSKPDRVCADSPHFPKQELVRRVLKPPDRMAVR